MQVKYLETRYRADGTPYYAVNPSGTARKKLGVRYKAFATRAEAIEYATEVAVRLDEHRRKNTPGSAYVDDSTVSGLLEYFRQTNDWRRLSDNSKRSYLRMMAIAESMRIGTANTTFGEMLVSNVKPEHADKFHVAVANRHSMHTAHHTVKVLRRVWNVGLRHGKARFNPWSRMGLQQLPDRVVVWTPQQVDTFIRTADEMGYWSLGTMALMCYHLCQRPGDVRKMRWSDLKDGVFDFVQEKTKTRVEVPASPQLMDRLRGRWPEEDGYIVLYESTGRPYDRRMYSKLAALVRERAGLPDELKLSDLRRTGATEMAEAGCTEDELRSVTGHQSRDVLSIYVRPTRNLAKSGIMKRFVK